MILLIGSINAGDTDHLDAALTAAAIRDSSPPQSQLDLGLREQSKLGSRTATPVFMGLENGMSHLTETLVSSLAGSDIRTGIPAKSVEVDGDKLKVVTDGVSFDSEAVVVATPAHQTARLLVSCQSAAERLSSIEHASVALVTLGFRRQEWEIPEGSGLLVPRSEGLLTTAVVGVVQMASLGGREHVILRVSAGRAGDTSFSAR